MEKKLSFGWVKLKNPSPRELNKLQKKAFLLREYYGERMQKVSPEVRDRMMGELADRLVDIDFQTIAAFIDDCSFTLREDHACSRGVEMERWKLLRDCLTAAQADELAAVIMEVRRGNSTATAGETTSSTSLESGVSSTDTLTSRGGNSTISVNLSSASSGG